MCDLRTKTEIWVIEQFMRAGKQQAGRSCFDMGLQASHARARLTDSRAVGKQETREACWKLTRTGWRSLGRLTSATVCQ
eukprot:scaffold504644_cov15-Prasinocladus_malaysianus.AAC.1